jgi:hypothetical protein
MFCLMFYRMLCLYAILFEELHKNNVITHNRSLKYFNKCFPTGELKVRNFWVIECLRSNMQTITQTLPNNFAGLILKLEPKYSIDSEFCFLYKSLTKRFSYNFRQK